MTKIPENYVLFMIPCSNYKFTNIDRLTLLVYASNSAAQESIEQATNSIEGKDDALTTFVSHMHRTTADENALAGTSHNPAH
jgi:hypothetical protein